MIISLHSQNIPAPVSFASNPVNYCDRICKITKEEFTVTLELLPGSYTKDRVSHLLQKISELGGGKGLYFNICIHHGCSISLAALKTLALALSPSAMAMAFQYSDKLTRLNLLLLKTLYSVNCPLGILESRQKAAQWLCSQQQ